MNPDVAPWNSESEKQKRLTILREIHSDPDNPSTEIIVPEIGLVYPDYDYDLVNQDLGWGGSQEHNLVASFTSLEHDSPAGAKIREIFSELAFAFGNIVTTEIDQNYGTFAVSFKVRKVLDKGVEDTHSQPGDLNASIQEDGTLLRIAVQRTPSQDIKLTKDDASLKINVIPCERGKDRLVFDTQKDNTEEMRKVVSAFTKALGMVYECNA